MAGRPSKPVELIVLENKNHITKAEIQARKQAEDALKTNSPLIETEAVKKNKTAHKEFLRLKKLYENIEFVEALDTQIVNRYCLGVSEMIRLRKMLDKMESVLDDKDLDGGDVVKAYTAINNLEGKLQQQEKLLLSYEDRLFLNPAGRMRAIPKKPGKKEATGIEAYRNRRNVQ